MFSPVLKLPELNPSALALFARVIVHLRNLLICSVPTAVRLLKSWEGQGDAPGGGTRIAPCGGVRIAPGFEPRDPRRRSTEWSTAGQGSPGPAAVLITVQDAHASSAGNGRLAEGRDASGGPLATGQDAQGGQSAEGRDADAGQWA